MKFPRFRAFTIFGQKWKVMYADQVDDDEDVSGFCSNTGTIQLRKGLRGNNHDLTYAHELAHAILMSMGKLKLSSDEEFVELLGRAIYGWITSGER